MKCSMFERFEERSIFQLLERNFVKAKNYLQNEL